MLDASVPLIPPLLLRLLSRCSPLLASPLNPCALVSNALFCSKVPPVHPSPINTRVSDRLAIRTFHTVPLHRSIRLPDDEQLRDRVAISIDYMDSCVEIQSRLLTTLAVSATVGTKKKNNPYRCRGICRSNMISPSSTAILRFLSPRRRRRYGVLLCFAHTDLLRILVRVPVKQCQPPPAQHRATKHLIKAIRPSICLCLFANQQANHSCEPVTYKQTACKQSHLFYEPWLAAKKHSSKRSDIHAKHPCHDCLLVLNSHWRLALAW